MRRTRKIRRRWRPSPAGFVALVLAIVLAWWLWPRDPYALPGHDWRVFKNRFLAEDGRVIDDGNGGISHSEGQGYGMLLAVAYHDRPTFDLIWNWTLAHLKQKDQFLFSWKWTPEDGGKVGDVNNASDGDLLLAWALLRGSREWNEYKYQQFAAEITRALLDKTVVKTYLGPQMLPGLVGFQKSEGVVVNPSYCVFPAITELGTAFPSDQWKFVRDGGIALLEAVRFGKWDLPPDWAFVGPNWVALAPDHDAIFGYNAIRVPLHIAWDDPSSPLLAAFVAFWQSPSAAKWDPAVVNLRTDAFGPYEALPGMLAVRELAIACVKKTTITVAQIPLVDSEESYYSASLKMLTKVAVRERFAPKRN